MSFLIPIQTPWLVSGACVARVCFIPWVGMTTVYPPNVAYKIISVCHVTLRFHMFRTCSHLFVVTRQRTTHLFRYRDRTLLNCVKSSLLKTNKFSKISFVVSDFLSIGLCCTPPSKTDHVALVSVHFCETSHAVRHTRKKHQHCGTLTFAPP